MAQNVAEEQVSQTYRNILFVDINESSVGLPINLATLARRNASKVQDGLGNTTPLMISRTEVGLSVAPQRAESLARLNEIINLATSAQNYSLVWS